MDDLVSSFSASHVSQEARDLATLQVSPSPLRSPSALLTILFIITTIQSQLANVIYYPSQNQSGVHCVTRRNSLAQPCNTPTPTSATAPFHWEWDDPARHRGPNPTPYVAPAPLRGSDIDDDEMEDEQAVEDILLNAHAPINFQSITPPHRHQHPPKFRQPTMGHSHQQHHHQQQPFAPALSPQQPPPTPLPLGSPGMYDATPVQSVPSQFANTDPFYLATVQASFSSSSPSSFSPTPPSFFAQSARLAPNSPFNLNLSAQQGHHPLELEPRTVLVGAGQSR